MSDIKRHHVRSKLAVLYLLSQTAETAKYVPATALFYEDSFKEMIKTYPRIYLKPDRGFQGFGVMRVDRTADGTYVINSNHYQVQCKNVNTLWRILSRLTGKKRYVIQQAIRSETVDNRPFDVRVHVFRIDGKWIVGGMYSRIDAHDRVTTNIERGAEAVSVDRLLRKHLGYSTAVANKIR